MESTEIKKNKMKTDPSQLSVDPSEMSVEFYETQLQRLWRRF